MPATEPQIDPGHPAGATGLSVTFWGVRGSAPVSGPNHETFGGSTVCLEVNAGQNRLIVDAGSGLRRLGLMLQHRSISTVDILLTHLHMDHLIGLMTFAPVFQQGASVTVHAPILTDTAPETSLNSLLGAPYSPVRPRDTGADFTVRSFRPGETITVSGQAVRTLLLAHPGGACAYRITHEDRGVAIVTDHEHTSGQPEPALAEFCSGADLILYDAHWDEAIDYERHRGWGHSTWQAGLRLLHAANARRLGCIHHAPEATDAMLFEREVRLRQQHAASFLAREGKTVHLAPSRS